MTFAKTKFLLLCRLGISGQDPGFPERTRNPPAKLSQVRSHAGLDIQAASPEEIAVSILTEIKPARSHRATLSQSRGASGYPWTNIIARPSLGPFSSSAIL
jgi:hypothetical protein